MERITEGSKVNTMLYNFESSMSQGIDNCAKPAVSLQMSCVFLNSGIHMIGACVLQNFQPLQDCHPM